MKSKLLLLFVFLYFIYGSILVIGSRTGFPDHMGDGSFFPFLSDQPVGEDGYYMLTVAWNIAEGRGIVYTYDMPTTGIQPLVTLIFSGIAWFIQITGGDKWIFIRAIMLLGIFLLPVYAHLIGLLASYLGNDEAIKEQAYLIGFVFTLFSIELFRWFTYGLETGVYLVLMAATILKFINLPKEIHLSRLFGLGILAGLTCLARIDFLVIFLLFLLISIARDRKKAIQYLSISLAAFLTVLPWFLYVFSVTGNWIPSSGGAQASFLSSEIIGIGGRIMASLMALVSYLSPWIIPHKHILLLLGSILVTGLLIFWIFWRRNTVEVFILYLKRMPVLQSWFLAIPILIIIYPVFFWAWHFYARYFAPITIPIYISFAVLIAERLRSASRVPHALLYSFAPVTFFVWVMIIYHTGTISNSFPVTTNYIQQNFSTAKVGAFQSGVAGFFNPNVVNLDGKVNHEALRFQQDDALHHYIDQEGIEVLIDWPVFFEKFLDENWLKEHWEPCPLEIPDGITICLIKRENR